MSFHLRIRKLLITNEGVFWLRAHRARKHPEVTWQQWDRL